MPCSPCITNECAMSCRPSENNPMVTRATGALSFFEAWFGPTWWKTQSNWPKSVSNIDGISGTSLQLISYAICCWSFEKTLPPSWTSAGWPRPDWFDGTCDARRFFSTCCLYFSRLTMFTMHLRPTDNFELKAQIFINDHRKFSSHKKSPGVSAGAAASDVPCGTLTIKQAVCRLRSK